MRFDSPVAPHELPDVLKLVEYWARLRRFAQVAVAYWRERMAGVLGVVLRGGRLLRGALMSSRVELGALS